MRSARTFGAGLVSVGLVATLASGCAQSRPTAFPGGGPTALATSGSASGPATTATTAPVNAGPTVSPLTGLTCTEAAAKLSLDEQVGQLFMVGVTGNLNSTAKAALTQKKVGSVILMGDISSGVNTTAGLTSDIAAQAKGVPLLIAVDQEGGLVQRLTGPGFDTIPSASEQGTTDLATLKADATQWGKQLRLAGVQLDLAPVADVVPAGKESTNAAIGVLHRGYGSDPAKVGERVATVIAAFHAAGIGSSTKHFPGIGGAGLGNTDKVVVTDDVTTADDASLASFRAAIAADTDTLMVSNVIYSRIDPGVPAVFSSKIMSLARGMRFNGVLISDDLGSAKAMAGIPVAERGVRFVKAGGDLAITVDETLASPMVAGLLEAAQADPALAARVKDAATRVLTLKARLGVTQCAQVAG